ncbi:hypothetical protein M7I_0962 [Glarea lozoyensis 74030]|uniref:Uncharacterized protein n=1 Tax=Glarea lozoyensis (strain ATCC 74030 / MF5533) TaxID=1104152 RepID=H0EES8_GLAL7|nr:hypothetical protein M7I_0962 [Glarea lozoyensis 74030]
MAVLKPAILLRLRKPPSLPSKRYVSNTSKPDDSTSIPVPNTVPTIPIWQRLGPLSRGFQAYGRSQRKWPFMFLNTHFNYPSRLLSLLTKVTVNQICFTPLFNTGLGTHKKNGPD